MLLEYGISTRSIPDPLRDYFVQAWLIGRYVIKVQLSPSPRKRHPYYITSFEKVPGTPVGNGLPDILSGHPGRLQRHAALAGQQPVDLVGTAGRGQRRPPRGR
jgi:hypothetical protein